MRLTIKTAADVAATVPVLLGFEPIEPASQISRPRRRTEGDFAAGSHDRGSRGFPGRRTLSLLGAEVPEQRPAEDGGYTHAVTTTDRKLSSRLYEPSDSDGNASGTDEADGLDELGEDAT